MEQVLTLELVFAIVAAIGVVYTISKNGRENDSEVLERLTRLETKLDGLAEVVDRHNKVVERTYKLESDLATAFKHIDLMRNDISKIDDVKIGGSQ